MFLIVSILRYVERHYMLQLYQTPNYEYLSHPLNAYQFICHVALGWNNIIKNMSTDQEDAQKIKDLSKVIIFANL